MKVVAIVGYHNSGKTTLAERLVKALGEKGYRVGYVKHDPKGHGVTDREGSDTWRIHRLGVKTALLSPGKATLWECREDDPLSLIREHFRDCDVVLLEGYKGLSVSIRIPTRGWKPTASAAVTGPTTSP